MTPEWRFVPSSSTARRASARNGLFVLVVMWGFVLVVHRNPTGLVAASAVTAFLVAGIAYVVVRPRPMVTVVLRPTSCRLEGARLSEISLPSIERAWLDTRTDAINIRHTAGVDAIPLAGFPPESREQIDSWFKQNLGDRYGYKLFGRG